MSTVPVGEAMQGLLRDLPARVPVERIEQLWLFRPRDLAGRESGLLVLSLRSEADAHAGQRQVVTLQYEAERVRGQLRRTDTLTEQGWAPPERIPRLIAGVAHRLRDETENPHPETIDGDPARWTELLRRLHALPVDPGNQE